MLFGWIWRFSVCAGHRSDQVLRHVVWLDLALFLQPHSNRLPGQLHRHCRRRYPKPHPSRHSLSSPSLSCPLRLGAACASDDYLLCPFLASSSSFSFSHLPLLVFVALPPLCTFS